MELANGLAITFVVLGILALFAGGYSVVRYGTMVIRLGLFSHSGRERAKLKQQTGSRSSLEILEEPKIARHLVPLALAAAAIVAVVIWTYSREYVEVSGEAAELTKELADAARDKSDLAAQLKRRDNELAKLAGEVNRLQALVLAPGEREQALFAENSNLKEQAAELRSKVQQLEMLIAERPELVAKPSMALAKIANLVADFDIEIGFGKFGAVAHERGDLQKATAFYEELRSLASNFKYLPGEAATAKNMAIVAELTGDRSKAHEYYRQALAITDMLAGSNELVTDVSELGIATGAQGADSVAKNFYEMAFKVADERQYLWGMGSAKMNLGAIFQQQGEFDAAEASYKEALVHFEEGEHKVGMAMTYKNLALLSSARGNSDLANKNYLQAIKLIREIAR